MNAPTLRAAIYQAPSRLSLGQLIRLSLLWFGLEFFWISQQFIVMSERVEHFVPIEHKGYYLGLIKGLGALVVITTQLSVGFISDHAESRLGRRRPFIIFGILWGCAAIVFFMLAPGYWWLFAAYMLIEATINVASIPFQSLLPDLVPEQQHSRAGAIMGLMHMGGYLVGLIAVMVMRVVYAGQSLSLLGDEKPGGYLVLLAAYLVILLGSMLVTVLGSNELGWAQALRDKVEGAAHTLRILPGVLVRFARTAPTLLGCILHDYLRLDLKSQPNFCWLAVSRFMIYLGYQTFLTYLYFYVNANLNGQQWLAGLGLGAQFEGAILPAIMLFFIFGGFAGNLLSAPVSERWGKKWAIGLGMVLAGVMVVPLIFTHSVWMAMASGTLLGCGWGAFIAADWAFACTLMPKQKAGSYMGIWDVTTLMPQILAPVIAGPIRDGIYNQLASGKIAQLGQQAGQLAAEAVAHQWLYATIILYFIFGLLLLRQVKEQRSVAV
jgi:Na+/melibiose symporter-like transporter